MINIIPIPAFSDNYIWLAVNPENHHAIVVDPGEALPVIDTLKQQRLTLDAILITHHHFDHTNGIAEILSEFPVPVYAPKAEKIKLATHEMVEGDNVYIENLELTFDVLEIPAHTHGHIAYYAKVHTPGILFCGDTLFAGGCGRLFEATAEQMVNSLKKLASLPDDTLIYCAHEYTQANLKFALAVEPSNQDLQQRIIDTDKLRQQGKPSIPSQLALEKNTNPFLRWHSDEVIQAAENRVGQTLQNPVDVFRVIREWKDEF